MRYGKYVQFICLAAFAAGLPSTGLASRGLQMRTDFNGDYAKDIAMYDNGTWHIFGNANSVQFGNSNMDPVPADYDGDGTNDLAAFEPSSATWHIFGSSSGYFARVYGNSEMVPVPSDFNGDGVADVALYDAAQGMWHILGVASVGWGNSAMQPVPSDYDGDGSTDVAVYEPGTGTWHIRGTAGTNRVVQFGNSEMTPVPGDYDGDGEADIALFEPAAGKWHIWQSSTGYTSRVFGNSEMSPVPGDYDADGSTDVAVFDGKTATWHVFGSTSGAFSRVYGNDQMVPLAETYNKPVPPEPPPQHLPILTGGEKFLYKPSTDLVLLPSRMRPGNYNAVNKVLVSRNPDGTDLIRSLNYTGNFGVQPKWRFNGEPNGDNFGNNFYVVAFFTAGGLPQPYLIYSGTSRQE